MRAPLQSGRIEATGIAPERVPVAKRAFAGLPGHSQPWHPAVWPNRSLCGPWGPSRRLRKGIAIVHSCATNKSGCGPHGGDFVLKLPDGGSKKTVSSPRATVEKFAATAAPEPPEEPPTVRSRS